MCAGVALVAPTKHLFFACLSCLFLSFLFGWLLQMFSHHASFVSFFSLWTQCTTSCGPGYQMRAVKCVVGSYGAVMDDTECNAATRPTDTQVRGLIVLSFSPQSAYYLLTLRAFFCSVVECEGRRCTLVLKMYTKNLAFHFHLVSIKAVPPAPNAEGSLPASLSHHKDKTLRQNP